MKNVSLTFRKIKMIKNSSVAIDRHLNTAFSFQMARSQVSAVGFVGALLVWGAVSVSGELGCEIDAENTISRSVFLHFLCCNVAEPAFALALTRSREKSAEAGSARRLKRWEKKRPSQWKNDVTLFPWL